MKVKNPSGREYYIQRAKDDRMANWCSRVTPVLLEFDGVPAEAYADPDRSDWIYIRFDETTYCNWAKKEGGFDLLTETTLRISDRGRTYRKRDNAEPAEPDHGDGDGDEGSSFEIGTEDRSLAREDLDAVVSHLQVLRDAVAVRAADPATNSHEYSSEFNSVVRQIVNEFHTRRFMYAFDYMSWMDEGQRLMEDHEAIATADLETIRKLLVVHWRSDYWDMNNEHWEQIAASGHLTALLERLAAIAEDMAPADASHRTASRYVWEGGDLSDITMPDETDSPGEETTSRRKQKWTHELRLKLYTRLLNEFGPYSTWGKVAYPANRKREFEEVLKKLAAEFSRITDDNFEWMALWQQMKWGTTTQGMVKNPGFASVYILNKAAALQTGFLKTSDLSGFVHVEPEISRNDES